MNLFLESIVAFFLFNFYLIKHILASLVPTSLKRKKSVSDQIVLVTGAGSGLGQLMSIEFAKLGARLVLWDVNEEANEQTATLVRQHGATAYAYKCDLSSRQEIYAIAKKVQTDVGEVDILVNNAGIVTGKKFLDCPDNMIEKTMQINAHAHFWTLKCFLPSMMSRNSGHLVNIVSAAGMIANSSLADYVASKHAAIGFHNSIALELKETGNTGIQTTCVCPYYINTGMFKGVTTRFPSIMPIQEPQEVVDQIMQAVLTNSKYLFTPGAMTLLCAFYGLIPTKCAEILVDFFGAEESMKNFVGRQKTA